MYGQQWQTENEARRRNVERMVYNVIIRKKGNEENRYEHACHSVSFLGGSENPLLMIIWATQTNIIQRRNCNR